MCLKLLSPRQKRVYHSCILRVGAMNCVPILKTWRLTVSQISGHNYNPPCAGQKISTARATVRGGPFLV